MDRPLLSNYTITDCEGAWLADKVAVNPGAAVQLWLLDADPLVSLLMEDAIVTGEGEAWRIDFDVVLSNVGVCAQQSANCATEVA